MFRPSALARKLARLALVLGILAAVSGAAAAEDGRDAEALACGGTDLIGTLAGPARSRLDERVRRAPFSSGNHWRARRGGQTITVIGTFHLYDPRAQAPMARLRPLIASADKVFLEGTARERAELTKALIARPDLLMMPDKTLPDLIPDDRWQALAAAVSARGIPVIIASKFRPWYASLLLGFPPCAMQAQAQGPRGLDGMIETAADAAGVPTEALEPFDTLFTVMDSLPMSDQIEMMNASVLIAPLAEDTLRTLSDAYFRQQHQMIMEFAGIMIETVPGVDVETIKGVSARFDQALIAGRNHKWLGRLLAAPERQIVVAVGAGHLGGEEGLLNLLAEAGYKLDRLGF